MLGIILGSLFFRYLSDAHIRLLIGGLALTYKTLFVGTTVVFFTLINLVKIVPSAILGQFSSKNLVTSQLLGPVAVVGVWLGMKLHWIIDAKTFYNLCYLFLFITGCKLLYDGIMALLK